MNGELLEIIYSFILSIFPYGSDYYAEGVTFDYVNGAFSSSLLVMNSGNSSYFNFFQYWIEQIDSLFGYGVSTAGFSIVSYFITWIVIVLLFLCLIRLFKWAFTLIFKLFKLN